VHFAMRTAQKGGNLSWVPEDFLHDLRAVDDLFSATYEDLTRPGFPVGGGVPQPTLIPDGLVHVSLASSWRSHPAVPAIVAAPFQTDWPHAPCVQFWWRRRGAGSDKLGLAMSFPGPFR